MTNTILFAGGEDMDVAAAGAAAVTTSGTSFRAGFARCALSVPGAALNPGGIAQGAFWRVAGQFSSAAFWFSARVYCTATTITLGTPSNMFLWRFLDANGLVRLRMRPASQGTSFSGPWVIEKLTTAGVATQLGASFAGVGNGAITKLDVQVNYSTTGGVTVYFTGSPYFTYSGDTTSDDGTAALAGVDLGWGGSDSSSGFFTGETDWSEVLVATTDTRTLNVVTLAPTGLGATAQWTGSYTGVNEVVLNDADGVATTTAGAIEEFTAGSLPAGTWGVVGVVVAARAATGTGQPQHLDLGLNIGGTDYWSSDQALGTSLARVVYDWETNPATGAVWTPGALAGVGLSLKAVA